MSNTIRHQTCLFSNGKVTVTSKIGFRLEHFENSNSATLSNPSSVVHGSPNPSVIYLRLHDVHRYLDSTRNFDFSKSSVVDGEEM
jgi:hypothetical protein